MPLPPILPTEGPRISRRRPGASVRALALASTVFALPSALVLDTQSAPPAFNREIKPILSDHCYACHGPDPGSRKAGLRLDTREGLFEATPKRGPAVVPGQPDASELWTRIVATDSDEVMPPPASHKELKPAQKELLQRWILQGALWQPHWSFLKPSRLPVPSVTHPGFPIRNPIDAFVLARLNTAGLAPNPEADRRTLARRLALDLTGLPPTPSDVEAFVQDDAPDFYERRVRALLASPRWGEHRARYWLDIARYADTHGLHFDNYREMWPYRDWVIRAFNRNLAFDRFSVEQVAGDLLPDPTEDQLIATGFHRCNATTNEGGTIEEENQVNYANDRVTTTAWVWLGLTLNCASCHDHKFDPFSMRDFYSLAAYFRNTTQSGFDGNVKDGANASLTVIEDPADHARWKELPDAFAVATEHRDRLRAEAESPFENWALALPPDHFEGALRSGLVLHAPLTDGHDKAIAGFTGGKAASFQVTGEFRWDTAGHTGPALYFGKDASVDLGDAGDFELGSGFSYGAWVFVPENFKDTAAIAARLDAASEHRGWDLWIQGDRFAAHFVNRWSENALKVRTRKATVRKGAWQHVLVTFDGSGRPGGVRFYVDGNAAETERDGPGRVRDSLRAKTHLRLGQRSTGSPFTGGAVQDFRLYDRVLAPPEVRALVHPEELQPLLTTPPSAWDAKRRAEMFDYYLVGDATFQQALRNLASLEDEREALRQKYPVTHIQRERTDSMPMAAVLFRGQYDKPKDKVVAATPAVLHPLPDDAPTNRLGLARWLVSLENPLSARVTVNRFWQEVFGTGLVRTTEDFGIMGDPPVNPELLDWLAVEFSDNGWDVKRLFELLVTSSTYRQSAATTPEKLEKDPANRLLSRGPRFRLDAEALRDFALAASGLLSPRIGGPSVKPYQPDGVWEAVAMPESDTRKYERGLGDDLYRRSLYTFWKRAAPPALMDLFNAPSRESCAVRRERTNTPLQALATLNDPQFFEAARVLAQTALLDAGRNPDAALDRIARRILLRPLQPEEFAELSATLAAMQAFYRDQPVEAGKLIAVGDAKPDPAIPATELAAFTMVANQLLNLDEVLSK